MSGSIKVSDFGTIRSYADRSLFQDGAAEFRVGPDELGSCLSLAMEGTRYAAWRARLMSGCVVRVRRSICSCHGYIAVVEMTTVPAEFPVGEEFP
jgi:hypothetical protein